MVNICNIKEFPDYYVTDYGEVFSITTNKFSNHKGVKKILRPLEASDGNTIKQTTKRRRNETYMRV